MQEEPDISIFNARWLLAVPFTIGLTVMAAGFLFTKPDRNKIRRLPFG